MKVTYIAHSGFAVEFEESILIFDYYQGEIPKVAKDKKKYYFVSHKHQDHFNFDIFKESKTDPNTVYFLSNDIKMSKKYMERIGVPEEAVEHIHYVRKNDTLIFEPHLKIETLRSTDEGVAFLIQYTEQGKTTSIYHAGDLNWWTWIGESEAEYKQMKDAFFTEMKKLEHRKFNLAFVPLDPRQEERFWWGFDAFMKTVDAKKVFPMHCWEDDYSVIGRLLGMEESKEYRDRIEEITQRGQTFLIEE